MATPDEVTGPINLGNPAEMTVKELAERVVALTASRSRIEYRRLPEDDPKQRQPDIARARSTLGWAPSTPLEAGLAKTVAYFDALLRSGDVTPDLSRRMAPD
jgi:UDP-glucuronate decarboxylase